MTIQSTDPATLEDYNALFNKNSRIEGFGIEGVTQVAACPFCAAPDWAKWRIMSVQEDMQQEHKCSHCGRSAKFLMEILDGGAGHQFELVQTGGAEPPDYLPPARRIDN